MVWYGGLTGGWKEKPIRPPRSESDTTQRLSPSTPLPMFCMTDARLTEDRIHNNLAPRVNLFELLDTVDDGDVHIPALPSQAGVDFLFRFLLK